jgi:predicted dehydrogenase
VIRVGIIGSNFGRQVLLPAFRADPRCVVAAIAGTDMAKTRDIAQAEGIAQPFTDWRAVTDHADIDAVAIAVLPRLQPEIAVRALKAGKAVFAEKPLADGIDGAIAIHNQASASGLPVIVDFEFCELPAWQSAKALIDDGALGALRHVVVTWQIENQATRMRLKSWKTSAAEGGGALGNFVSHCFYYLEHLCGPLRDLSARLFALPRDVAPSESSVSLAGTFQSGAGLQLAMSAASYLGSGHRIEFYGEEGTLVLSNPTIDYMRGFELFYAKRPAASLERVDCPDPDRDRYPDGRIAPVARLAKRWFDAIEQKTTPIPGIRDGVRVQELIDAARRSHRANAQIVTVQP